MIAVLATAAAFGAAASGSASHETVVTIVGKAFSPGHVTVLVGEQVRWSNQDNATHNVTAEDHSFDSGHLPSGADFAQAFQRPGAVAYKCTLHRYMHGTVDVVGIALAGPEKPVAVGAGAVLAGRAPAGSGPVTLERIGAGPVATATPAADGRFSFTVTADRPGAFRASTGGLTSAVVGVPVAPDVRLAARRGGMAISVRVHVPAQPRATVILEQYVRERFGYVRVRKLRLDGQARAHLRLHTRARLRLRARLARPVGGFARSASAPVVVTRGQGAAMEHRDHH